MKKHLLIASAVFAGLSVSASADILSFSSFVSGSSINAVEGQNSTIAYTYAGNKFVGSVYIGVNNLQLYSTDLTGGNVQKFGTAMSNGFSGEVVVGSSLALGGFTNGDVFAGAGSQIYRYSNSGGAPTLFSTVAGTARGILFATSGPFAGKMLVSTTSGNVYTIDSAGVATVLANVGEDTEGMDIATSNWGPYAGQVLVSSEGSGALRFINAAGVVTDTGIRISAAETVSFVPLNLGASGNSVEGFYLANYPVDIQKAGASQFAGLQGHVMISSEFGSNSQIVDYSWNGSSFVNNGVDGHLRNQSEDGIFVTADRVIASTPEPGSLLLFGTVLAAGFMLRRKLSA